MAVTAVLLWLAVFELPGFAAARLLVRAEPTRALAVSAPLSVAIFYLVGLLASRLDLPVILSSGLAALILTGTWLVTESIGWHRRRVSASEVAPVWRATSPSGARAHLLLIAAIGVGVVLWQLLHARLSVPAGWDAMHHGYFVRQIVDHDTMNESVVLSSDPGHADGTASFYPLGINLMTAILHNSTGISISTLIQTSEVAAAGVILPVGVYVLSRQLAPDLPLAAGFAALFSVFPADLFSIDYTGRVTAVIGLSLVPSAVLGMAWLGSGSQGWRAACTTFLAIVGMIGVHTSEVPQSLGMAFVIMVAVQSQTRRLRMLWIWLVYLVGAGGAAIAVMWMADPRITNIASERSGSFGTPGHRPFRAALGQYLALPAQFYQANDRPMAIWSLIAIAGCVVSILPRFRAFLALSVCYVGFGVFYLAWLTGHIGPFERLADPWYRDSGRMVWVFLVLGAFPGGLFLAAMASGLMRVISGRLHHGDRSRRLRPMVAPAACLVTAVVAAILVLPPVGSESNFLHRFISPVGPDYEAAFSYLREHVGPDDRVLDDLRNHGDMWMYVDDNVPVLFGNAPLIRLAPDSWKERLYLRGELHDIDTNGCVRALLAKFHVTYVFYGKRSMGDGTRHIGLDTLEDTMYFEPVYVNGDARVFKVNPTLAGSSPASCAGVGNVLTKYPWNSLANAR